MNKKPGRPRTASTNATEVIQHKPTGELIKKAKRPSVEKPADTPVKKVLKQGVNDRVVAGNEADRSDALRAVNCAEHDWDIRDKDGVNRCIEHKETLDASKPAKDKSGN